MILTTDASSLGWGYQTIQGHQGKGTWFSRVRTSQQLQFVRIAVHTTSTTKELSLRDCVFQFLTDNNSVVYCLNHQGTVRSPPLLHFSEEFFQLAEQRNLLIVSTYVEGIRMCGWMPCQESRSPQSIYLLKGNFYRSHSRGGDYLRQTCLPT